MRYFAKHLEKLTFRVSTKRANNNSIIYKNPVKFHHAIEDLHNKNHMRDNLKCLFYIIRNSNKDTSTMMVIPDTIPRFWQISDDHSD